MWERLYLDEETKSDLEQVFGDGIQLSASTDQAGTICLNLFRRRTHLGSVFYDERSGRVTARAKHGSCIPTTSVASILRRAGFEAPTSYA
jgi:hypothetical protein